jgi:hypothetical protein
VPAATGKASITGVIVDSLRGSYLASAEVLVEGAQKSVVTDSLGRFRLDGLKPGTYQVGVFHPVLDSLGIALATRPFHVGADSVSVVVLGVPSAATIIARSCEARPLSQGASAVIGRVIDPETLQPVANADVSIAWTEIEVSKSIGLRQSPRVVRDSTDAAGRFNLCGLPSSLEASLQARRGRSVTSAVGILLGDAPIEVSMRTLLLASVDSGAKTGNAVVTGRVRLEGASSLAGTRVELAGTDAVAITDAKGEFALRNLPSGSHSLVARHIGYAADVVDVDLSAREPKNVTMTLPKFVSVMDPVLVTARRSAALEKVGFARRRKSGVGRFLGPEELERIQANQLTDILRRVPGLKVTYGSRGEEIIESTRGASSLIGGNCVKYWVDDMPWFSMEPGDVNAFVQGGEVVGVEVYQGSVAPAQYSGMGNCTAIVLWTRMRIRN